MGMLLREYQLTERYLMTMTSMRILVAAREAREIKELETK
jgi:hypothetical protein